MSTQAKISDSDLNVIKESLKHGYLIPHYLIRSLVAENERLTKEARACACCDTGCEPSCMCWEKSR